MSWKDWKYWKRGAIIGTIFFIADFMLWFISMPFVCSGGLCWGNYVAKITWLLIIPFNLILIGLIAGLIIDFFVKKSK